MEATEKLALFGGPKAVAGSVMGNTDMFKWPIVTSEDEEAVLEVLRNGAMSGIDITMKFEQEFADWLGMTYALGFNNGTNSILAAMYGCKVGVGDEIICPSVTYWASALPAYALGATIVFAEIDPVTLCLDPADIEHRITGRTKAIVVVHYLGHPADMDRIIEIAREHKIKVIEDVSHAQGGYYKGRRVGTIGDVGAMSLMAGKSFAVGEAGIFVTNDRDIYERAIALGHYERFNAAIRSKSMMPFRGLPFGGYKFRMHQMSAAVGRVQLRYYEERMNEIDKAMNNFWDRLEGVPGLRAHRPAFDSGSTMGGWYAAHGLYVPEELGGLSVTRFCEAVRAEGADTGPGCNLPLHLHPLLHEVDVYGHGKPTVIAHAERDVRQSAGSLPVSEQIGNRVFSIPWFKHHRPEIIERYALAFRKVATQYESLLAGDPGNPETIGGWNFYPGSRGNGNIR